VLIRARARACVCVYCVGVCVCVYPQHNSKTNDPEVFKLGIGNDLGYPRNDVVLGFKGQGQGHKVQTY